MRKRLSLFSFLIVALVFTGLTGTFLESVNAQKRSLSPAEREKQSSAEANPSTISDSKDALAPTAAAAGTLTLSDPTFNRPSNCTTISGVGTAVHYDVIPFTVSTAGTVTLSFETADGGSISPQGTGTAGPDTFMILYTGAFNAAAPLTNCTTINDDISGATNARSRISQALAVGTYNVVVTSFNNTPTLTATDAPLPWTYTLAVNGATPITTAGQIIISEFRVRGPSGANDEFIELYNTTGAPLTTQSRDATAGLAVAASDGIIRCTIPNGTVIPTNGHFLCTNSVGYSLGGYAAGNLTYTTDIPDNAGIAIFNTAFIISPVLADRLDAVGSANETNTLYKEGTGYPALTPFNIDYSFYRDLCGKQGSIINLASCTRSTPADTDNNATDFVFVDSNGTSAGAGQRLGAAGPENLASPTQQNTQFPVVRLDSIVSIGSPPNYVRDFTSDPANNSTFGTLDIRRRIINNTGAPVTRLRYRITDFTTFPAPSGFADLRPRTSTDVVVAGITDAATCLASNGVATTPCSVTVRGTTLEQPPSQPNGGGFNSSLSSSTVTLATPLAAGASINVRFLFGIQQTGTAKFAINVEALPTNALGSTSIGHAYKGSTDGPTAANVSVSGRVLNPQGRGLTNARVTITGTDGISRSVISGRMGTFLFSDVESGQDYMISIGSRRYSYSTRLVTVNDNISDLAFYPEQ